MSSFDDLLKKGKDKIVDVDSGDRADWRGCINEVMGGLKKLQNDMYNPKETNMQIDSIKCKDCGNRGFIMTIVDLANKKKRWKFKFSGWKTIKYKDKSVFLCSTCSKKGVP